MQIADTDPRALSTLHDVNRMFQRLGALLVYVGLSHRTVGLSLEVHSNYIVCIFYHDLASSYFAAYYDVKSFLSHVCVCAPSLLACSTQPLIDTLSRRLSGEKIAMYARLSFALL